MTYHPKRPIYNKLSIEDMQKAHAEFGKNKEHKSIHEFIYVKFGLHYENRTIEDYIKEREAGWWTKNDYQIFFDAMLKLDASIRIIHPSYYQLFLPKYSIDAEVLQQLIYLNNLFKSHEWFFQKSEKLERILGVSKSTIQRSIFRLKNMGFIDVRISKDKNSHHYNTREFKVFNSNIEDAIINCLKKKYVDVLD